MSIKANMKIVLEILTAAKTDQMGEAWVSATQLQKDTNLSPADLNNAVEILVTNRLVKWLQSMGTAPFKFLQATITPQGRLSLE